VTGSQHLYVRAPDVDYQDPHSIDLHACQLLISICG
jgi:hypothetical protein